MQKTVPVMDPPVAVIAQSDQILLGVVPRPAAKCLVVHLKMRHGAATLASPAVST